MRLKRHPEVYAHRGHRGDHDAAESLGALIDDPD